MRMTAKQARYDLARLLNGQDCQTREDCIEKMLDNGMAALVERPYGCGFTLTIMGRKATSSRNGMRWPHVYVVKNWIKSTLKKDAPEGST